MLLTKFSFTDIFFHYCRTDKFIACTPIQTFTFQLKQYFTAAYNLICINQFKANDIVSLQGWFLSVELNAILHPLSFLSVQTFVSFIILSLCYKFSTIYFFIQLLLRMQNVCTIVESKCLQNARKIHCTMYRFVNILMG